MFLLHTLLPASWITSQLEIYSTHWGRNKIATILQTTFSSTFPWTKTVKFRWNFIATCFICDMEALVHILALCPFERNIQLIEAEWRMYPSYANHHWFRQWFVACSVPIHYLNQCWNSVNWASGNKYHRNLNRNSRVHHKCSIIKLIQNGKGDPYDCSPE